MSRCKCCFAYVYFRIIDTIILNLSSNFNLLAMYRSITEHKYRRVRKIHILGEKFRRHLKAFASELFTYSTLQL